MKTHRYPLNLMSKTDLNDAVSMLLINEYVEKGEDRSQSVRSGLSIRLRATRDLSSFRYTYFQKFLRFPAHSDCILCGRRQFLYRQDLRSYLVVKQHVADSFHLICPNQQKHDQVRRD